MADALKDSLREDAPPTLRSKLLATYFRFKGVEWFMLGVVLIWTAVGSGVAQDVGLLRLLAAFLILFAAPAVLLWTLAVVVKLRHSTAWWIGSLYVLLVLISKASLGIGELPRRAWYWLSTHVSQTQAQGVTVFVVFTALVYAFDVAALLALISPKGRHCFGIGGVGSDQVDEEGDESGWL